MTDHVRVARQGPLTIDRAEAHNTLNAVRMSN